MPLVSDVWVCPFVLYSNFPTANCKCESQPRKCHAMVIMKRKRVLQDNPGLPTSQAEFAERFAGTEDGWSRLFGHIQGHGFVTRKGDCIVLGTACEAHGDEMALTLRPCECERSLADPAPWHLCFSVVDANLMALKKTLK